MTVPVLLKGGPLDGRTMDLTHSMRVLKLDGPPRGYVPGKGTAGADEPTQLEYRWTAREMMDRRVYRFVEHP